MKSLRHMAFLVAATLALAAGSFAQKDDQKKPPKDPPVIRPADKEKPRETPTPTPQPPPRDGGERPRRPGFFSLVIDRRAIRQETA